MASSTDVFRIKGLHYYLSVPSSTAYRTSQSIRSETVQEESSEDPWSEIDRRNDDVLQPIRKRNAKKSSTRLSIYSDFTSKPTKGYHLNSYHHYRTRGKSSEQAEDPTSIMNPAAYLNKYANKPSTLTHLQSDSTFLFGNSIVKSNKAEALTAFEQQLLNGDDSHIFVNKHGVIISEDGPFWPDSFRILHPTPRFVHRNSLGKEFYLPPANPHPQHHQTFDNQPAIYKYTEPLKHSIIVYDMEKSPRNQMIKTIDDEHQCPSLMFESRFEGGNLRQAKRVGQFEYELILRPDLYTRRHTQWYFFRVQNMIANITYRFRIINLTKKTSLYSEGMQVLLFSDVESKKESRSWFRVGHHINYGEYKSRSYNALLERDINYYELDFQFEFPHSGDTCYLAHCYPYTYTDLREDLDQLALTRPRSIFRRDILCESRAGNSCFLITVTDENVPVHKKKFVLITARIHPGETNSSYMMRGLLEYITSNDKTAQKLRSQLVFKIIPMLNPDGVIVGNYRCSLTGKDMNRNFRHPRKQTFPIIYHFKEMIQHLQKEQREILAFCDLHGHSRKSNVFAYGCDGCDGPQPDMRDYLNARVLPFIMSRTAPDMFAFDYCKFHIHRCKESTGRVVMWKEMLIKNSFTLEASFGGSSIVEKPHHFNIHDFEKFGRCICQSLGQYLEIVSDSARLDSLLMDITRNLFLRLDKEKIPPGLHSILYPDENVSVDTSISIDSISTCLEALQRYRDTLDPSDISSSSDSDSDPEGGELPDIGYRTEAKPSRKKSKKRRAERAFEERVQKLNQKRQMEQNARMLPQRGTLFTSKYAHRSGNGLPIFTTERALERRHQKRSDSAAHDGSPDRATNENTENEPEQALFIPRNSSAMVDSPPMKRTSSLISIPVNDLLNPTYDPSRTTKFTIPTAVVRTSIQRHSSQIFTPSAPETSAIEYTTRFTHPLPFNDHENLFETAVVPSSSSSTVIPRSRLSLTHQYRNSKRYLTHRINDYTLPQTSSNTVDALLRERVIIHQGENSHHPSDPINRINQILRKRLY